MYAALRQQAGLSQKELAKLLKTSQQQISRLESASYEDHSLSMLRRVAESFDFTGKPRGLDLSKSGVEIPFFPMEQIPLGRIHVSEFTRKPLAKLGSGTYVENCDLMVAKITPSFENGKQAIVDIDTDFTSNDR